ncbi:hypothetical protein M1N62_03395 [Thermodesulfovibrionales bacterium]|nr:hypothetical protein [Thermodesulfovibrionales bacterium]
MPTISIIGSYRFFFTPVIEMNLNIFMLSEMIRLPSFGLIQSGCRVAEDLTGWKLVESRR